jgi:hypothetical protein
MLCQVNIKALLQLTEKVTNYINILSDYPLSKLQTVFLDVDVLAASDDLLSLCRQQLSLPFKTTQTLVTPLFPTQQPTPVKVNS